MPGSRYISFAERATLVILISYFCIHSLPRAWKSLVTDFPNYYLAARIAHEGVDSSRMYDWRWFERQKDHHGVDVRVIGLVPITPFSTLFVWPLTGLPPLAAKRLWILLNLLLLVPITWMLKSITGLSYERIGLVIALCFPLYRNLEYGQFYVVLLLMIVSACWVYLRGMHAFAGSLVAIAAACKIFPVLIFVFFLQRRAWRALVWGSLAGVMAIVISVGIFGVSVHRTYLFEILPWVMHGEAMPPYFINASLAGVLHVLFLSEPQWNPNPWHSSVAAYAVLLPALQMLILAPAILLTGCKDCSPKRIALEWSAIITGSLAVSTNPASYHFVLMIFPICVVTAALIERRQYGWLGLLFVAFVGIGFPMPHPASLDGPGLLLYVPRLPSMILVLAEIYVLLWPSSEAASGVRNWTRYAWVGIMVFAVILSSHSTFVRERAVRQEYAYRLPLQEQGLLNADPQTDGVTARYIAFTIDGYRLMPEQGAVSPGVSNSEDVLSFDSHAGHLLLEDAADPSSRIIDLRNALQPVVVNGRNPMSSTDGRSVAYIRDDHGRGALMVHEQTGAGPGADKALSPPSLNVYEASFQTERGFAFSASTGGTTPEIYVTDVSHENAPLGLPSTRYPALSPDGLWLAYSQLDHGIWNLWVRNERTGASRRVGNVPCNQIEPAWENDSKTVLYSTDCGRALWFTAVARRKIIP